MERSSDFVSRDLLRQAVSARGALALTIGLSVLGALLTVGQAWYLSHVVDRVFLGGESLVRVAGELRALLAVVVLRAVAAGGSDVAAGTVAMQVKTDLRRALFDRLLVLGPAYTRGERTGELTAAAVEGIESLEAYFSQYLPQIVVAALVPLAILVAVFPIDLLSGLVLLVTAPLIPIFMILIGKAAEALTRRQYELLSRLSAHFLDVLQGLTTLKVLGQSRAQARTIARISDHYRLATMSVLRVAFLSALVLEIVATISTAIVAVEVGLRLLYGHLAFQEALFVLILAPEFYLPLRMLGARFHAGASGVSAARRIFEILATPLPNRPGHPPSPPVRSSARTVSLPARSIAFCDVHYSYGGERPALRGVSFEIRAGQKVALVGPSGAGKSTIANLLLRFIDPDRGEILIDGVPLWELPAEVWRERIAWVPQRPHIFHDTIAANIRLGRPGACDDDIIRAAEAAQIHEFVRSLPLGYETVVGEHGARLSSGQAQRVALARAFLKDAPLLILDEPTSSVDPELEALLKAATDRLVGGRTVLVIAHRLSTVYLADQIVVLDGGRVVESGRHAALVRSDGLYRRLLAANPAQGDPV